MTKSTITDERITSVIERLDHFASNLKWTDVRGAQDLLTAADGLRELQERRKAAMDSEPVAYIGEKVLEDMAEGYCGRVWPFNKDELSGESRIPLYRHAQAAPVVSADLLHTAASAIEDLLTTKDRTGAGVWFDLPGELRRAAMLQAEPVTTANKLGNSPEQRWSRCCTKGAPVLDSPSKNAESRCGNSPAIPDGYVMVPKEPTRDILDEFDSIIDYGAEDSEDAWRRLLAAAPQEVGDA